MTQALQEYLEEVKGRAPAWTDFAQPNESYIISKDPTTPVGCDNDHQVRNNSSSSIAAALVQAQGLALRHVGGTNAPERLEEVADRVQQSSHEQAREDQVKRGLIDQLSYFAEAFYPKNKTRLLELRPSSKSASIVDDGGADNLNDTAAHVSCRTLLFPRGYSSPDCNIESLDCLQRRIRTAFPGLLSSTAATVSDLPGLKLLL